MMTKSDQIQFHSNRAMQEFDSALRASHEKAARAHFGLSALHLQSLRRLHAPEESAPAPEPVLEFAS